MVDADVAAIAVGHPWVATIANKLSGWKSWSRAAVVDQHGWLTANTTGGHPAQFRASSTVVL